MVDEDQGRGCLSKLHPYQSKGPEGLHPRLLREREPYKKPTLLIVQGFFWSGRGLRFSCEESALHPGATAELLWPKCAQPGGGGWQEELDPRGLSHNCDEFGLNDMWWDSLLTWGSTVEEYRLCWRDWQGG